MIPTRPAMTRSMFRSFARCFSTTSSTLAGRAIVYSQSGAPSSVLSAFTYPTLPPPSHGTVNIRFLLSPINPADINVIQGAYPSKPAPTTFSGSLSEDVFVGGNEGLAVVQEVGEGNEGSGLQEGDWVVLTKQQGGTWNSSSNIRGNELLKVPRKDGVTEVHAATLTVCPPLTFRFRPYHSHDLASVWEATKDF